MQHDMSLTQHDRWFGIKRIFHSPDNSWFRVWWRSNEEHAHKEISRAALLMLALNVYYHFVIFDEK